MRVTLANMRDPQWCRAAYLMNVDPSSARYTSYVNAACRKIFFSGKNFFDLTARFAICTYNSCLTFPRRVAAIEALWVCNQPITLRNQWFEYLDSGPWLQTPEGRRCTETNGSSIGCNGNFWCNFGNGYDRGTACTFTDIRGLNKKIRIYNDVAETADAFITLQGYDENGIWIRTQVDGEWIDGEQVEFDTPYATSTKFFSNLTAVVKPITNGNIRLYEYNTDEDTQRAIAVYEPSEINPSYRRMLIPGLENARCCNTDSSDEDDDECQRVKVTAIARLEYVPVANDNDWVIPGNPDAVAEMMQSVREGEMHNPEQMMFHEGKCLSMLSTQLRHYLGHSLVQPIRRQPSAIANAGPGLNII